MEVFPLVETQDILGGIRDILVEIQDFLAETEEEGVARLPGTEGELQASRPKQQLGLGKFLTCILYTHTSIVDAYDFRSAVEGAEKKPVQPAAAQERSIPEPAPVPASNQWAKGKPKIEYPQEKVVPPPPVQVQQQHPPPPSSVPSVPVPQPTTIASPPQQPQPQPPIQQLPSPLQAPAPQPQPAAASNEILAPIDQSPVTSSSWGGGQVENAAASNIKVPMHSANGSGSALQAHAPAHAAPVVGPSGGSRNAETLEKSQEGRFRERGAAPNTAETDNLRNNFASLNVGQQTKIEGAVPAQQAAATAAGMQTNASLAFSAPSTDTQQMPYSMPAQAGASGYGQPYPQYAPQYSQQFAQMQSNYPQAQDGEDFNAAGRMQGMGIGESGYAIAGGEAGVAQRGNSGNYGGKGAHGKQVQQPPQQAGMGMQQWQQAPLLNQYPGMMSNAAAAMYSQYAMAGIPTAQQVFTNDLRSHSFYTTSIHELTMAGILFR